MKKSKVLLAGLLAAGLLSAAVSSASANRLSLNEPRFRAVWSSLNVIEEVGGVSLRCPVTLEGSFHSATIRKVIRALIGYITRATAQSGACTGGTATILQERLPWHITYEGFTGTLPRITGLFILLRGVGIQTRVMGPFGTVTCLIAFNNLLFFIPGIIEAGGAFKPEVWRPGSETFSCGGLFTEHFTGEGRLTRLGATEQILIRLI